MLYAPLCFKMHKTNGLLDTGAVQSAMLESELQKNDCRHRSVTTGNASPEFESHLDAVA